MIFNLFLIVHSPLWSAGGLDDGRHAVSEEVFALAQVDNVEDNPLQTKQIAFSSPALTNCISQVANLPNAQIRGSIAAISESHSVLLLLLLAAERAKSATITFNRFN